MKFKVILLLCVILILYSRTSYTQVAGCTITLLDSNNIKKTFTLVTLQDYNSDNLTYLISGKPLKVQLKNLISLKYLTDSKSSTGLIIGASAGAAIGIGTVILLSGSRGGHPDLSSDVSGIAIFGGVAFVAVLGGIIGGIIQSPHTETKTVNFSGLTDREKRDELKLIFRYAR